MQLREDIQLLNMVMIQDDKGNVLVQDKVKKEGWEGLTFPGGKVEQEESFADSVRREAKEETGLTLGRLTFCGFVHWMHDGISFRQVGLLYKTDDFSGEVRDSEEGHLSWINYEEFKRIQPKSDCMDEMLAIYDGEYSEVWIHYKGNDKGEVRFG